MQVKRLGGTHRSYLAMLSIQQSEVHFGVRADTGGPVADEGDVFGMDS